MRMIRKWKKFLAAVSSIVEDDSGVKEKKSLIEKGDKVNVVEYDDKSSSKQLLSLKPVSTTTTTSSFSTTFLPDQDDSITTEEKLSTPLGLNSK